jgi:hypothetical protein
VRFHHRPSRDWSEHTQASVGEAFSSVRIAEVWERLGGAELHHGRGRAFWRNGDGLNVALDLERQLWFDYAAGAGGGVLALVQAVLNCDRRAALAWLHDEGFLETTTFSPEERRAYSRRREAASIVARDIEHWRVALAEELNARKLEAAETGDFDELGRAASLCHLLENGSPEAFAWEFFGQRKADPEGTARLIEAGRQFENESRWIAAWMVVMLARQTESEACGAA